jgi:hypothetical protein
MISAGDFAGLAIAIFDNFRVEEPPLAAPATAATPAQAPAPSPAPESASTD